jgi:hypothetical protein
VTAARLAVQERVGVDDLRVADEIEQRLVGDGVGVEVAARQVDSLTLDQLL